MIFFMTWWVPSRFQWEDNKKCTVTRKRSPNGTRRDSGVVCATIGMWRMILTCSMPTRKRSADSVLKMTILSKKMISKKIFVKRTMNNNND